MSKCLEFLGIFCGVIGLISAIITCVLPLWRVAVFKTILPAHVVLAGLWMNCISQSKDQMQCKTYDSTLDLPQDLQAARYMTVISIILGILGVLISIVGAKRMKQGAARAKVMMIPGVFFILAGVLVLISVCWSAHTIIWDLSNPLLDCSRRMKLGVSLYIGWASAALFLIGGVLLCSRCSSNERNKPPRVVYINTDGGHNNRNNV